MIHPRLCSLGELYVCTVTRKQSTVWFFPFYMPLLLRIGGFFIFLYSKSSLSKRLSRALYWPLEVSMPNYRHGAYIPGRIAINRGLIEVLNTYYSVFELVLVLFSPRCLLVCWWQHSGSPLEPRRNKKIAQNSQTSAEPFFFECFVFPDSLLLSTHHLFSLVVSLHFLSK